MARIVFTTYDDDGEEMIHYLPARMEVCDRCNGEGTHVNPAIDGNGITSEEMRELGDEFLEDYLGGRYDVTCEECKGANVVPVLDESRCDPELLALYHKEQQEIWESRAEERAEARAFGYY